MRKKAYAALLCAMILVATCTVPCGSALAEKTGTVIGGWLILRDSPSFSGNIRSSYPAGTVVTITGQQGSWYAVKAPDGLTGYMLGEYLKVSGSGGSGSGSGSTGSKAYVTSPNGLNVRLRSGPGTGYSILAAYAPGTVCTILSSGTDWSRIQIGSLTGYMMTCYLSGSPSATPAPQTSGTEYEVYVTSRNGQGVNLRSGPDKSYSAIGFYSVGSPAWMVSAGNTWSYIRIGNRYGYMMSQFLTTEKPEPQKEPVAVGGAYIVSANGRNVNLRSGPSTVSAILKSFPVNTKLSIITRGTDWYFIQIEGYYGYMMRQFIYDSGLSADPTRPQPERNDSDDDDDDDDDEDEEDDDDEDAEEGEGEITTLQ